MSFDDGDDPYDPYGMFGGGVRTRPRPVDPWEDEDRWERWDRWDPFAEDEPVAPSATRRPSRPASRPAPRAGARRGAPRAARTARTARPARARAPERDDLRADRPPLRLAPARQAPPVRRAAARPNPFRRLRFLVLLFVCLFAVLVGRLSQLQVVDRGPLEQQAASQVTRLVPLEADRGALLDRAGDDLALSADRTTIVADPRLVTDPQAAAAALAPIVGVDAAVLEDRLDNGPDDAFEYVARQVDDRVAERVRDLGLAGIFLEDEQARFNPAGDLARTVLGTVDVDGNGISGLERQYQELLQGRPGEQIVERDGEGRTIPQSRREVTPAVPGTDLVLTLDRSIQNETERALCEQILATGALGGTALVSNPRTGELYAMANLVVDETGACSATGGNTAVTAVFEPGSVNKVITLAAALEEGVVSPSDHRSVPYTLQVADRTFHDHDPRPDAWWTPTDILTTSSNIGTMLLAQDLGRERLDEYMRRFGFGRRTALDFPNESAGLLLDVDDWSGSSLATIAIGQGIAVTPLQLLAAYNVIANDGVYVAPRLVLETRGADGEVGTIDTPAPQRVVSPTTARQVRDMMVSVVAAGTGQQAAIDGYTVAGKTGTARKPQSGGGADAYQDAAGNYHYVSTFAGFVPAQDPQLSVVVVIDEPSNGYYASQIAAPVFREIAAYSLGRLRVPPPATPFVSSVPAPTAGVDPTDDIVPGRVRTEPAADDDGGADDGGADDVGADGNAEGEAGGEAVDSTAAPPGDGTG